MFVEGLTKFAFYIFFYSHGGVEEIAEATDHLLKYISPLELGTERNN